MHRVYRYVGPPEIARAARGQPPGAVVLSRRDLGPSQIVTWVVDLEGQLRIADRSSEHIACAAGLPVLGAGELEIADGCVVWASNLSTGFCPEPACEAALRRALDRAGVDGPDALEPAFEMRRCDECSARNVIKEGELECAQCGAALSPTWNFDRVRWSRGWTAGARIDQVEVAERGEDRVLVTATERGLRVALADGAGGMARGAEAAECVVAMEGEPVKAIRRADELLAASASGESTAVLVDVSISAGALELSGASCGDSALWARVDGAWTELTEGQARRPLVGSGQARPRALPAACADALLVASDGLMAYVPWADIEAALHRPDVGFALADRARPLEGGWPDDLSAIVVTLAAPSG